MKHGVKVTGLASADDVTIWKTYQWERLIVDTTAQWSAGEKDGITVVDEVHPTGQRKKGYIKPKFGTWQELDYRYDKQSGYGDAEECWRFKGSASNLESGKECEKILEAKGNADWYQRGHKAGSPLDIVSFFQRWYFYKYYFATWKAEGKARFSLPPGSRKFKYLLWSVVPKGSGVPMPVLNGVQLKVGNNYWSEAVPENGVFWLLGAPPSGHGSCQWGNAEEFDVEEWGWGFWSDDSVNRFYYLPPGEDQGIWSRTFSNITSDDYENYDYSDTNGQNGITGEWVDGKWKVTIDFPYEEGEPTTWFDRFRYDFKEKKTEENPA